MTRLLPVLLAVALTVYALVDVVQSPPARVRTMPRLAWAGVILLLPVVGAVAWLLTGRPSGGGAGRRPGRPIAPDDDPDFLRGL